MSHFISHHLNPFILHVMHTHVRSLSFLFLLIMLQACSLNIGDSCVSSNQCEIGQICDLSSTGGYCTITPCTIDSCPNESVCVTFENERSYCMALCKTGEDCREGYMCDEQSAVAPFCRQKAE